jgi:hypothetical protein
VRIVTGREPVAAGLLQFFGPSSSTTLLSLPALGAGEAGGDGRSGVVALRAGRVVTIATLTMRDGLVAHIDAVADPAKLAPWQAALGM